MGCRYLLNLTNDGVLNSQKSPESITKLLQNYQLNRINKQLLKLEAKMKQLKCHSQEYISRANSLIDEKREELNAQFAKEEKEQVQVSMFGSPVRDCTPVLTPRSASSSMFNSPHSSMFGTPHSSMFGSPVRDATPVLTPQRDAQSAKSRKPFVFKGICNFRNN